MNYWHMVNYNIINDPDDMELYDYLAYRWASNCIDWDDYCRDSAKYLAEKYPKNKN